MRDVIKYYDRNNVLKLTLNAWPFYSEFSDLMDWLWNYNEQYGKINTFRREKKEYKLVIGIASEFKKHHDQICDIFDADVIAGSPGYLELNGWRLPCYITTADHEFALDLDRKAEFVVRSVNSTWIRTTTKAYNGISGGASGGEDLGRDYTYTDDLMGRGYNYGYSQPESHYAEIELPGTDNGYEVMVYGPAVNPVIYLDNKPVQVNIELTATERLKIVSNGSVKTIQVLSPSGVATDAFVYRDKENTPFLTIGQHTELTYGQVRFDFTTIERRSRPSWI